MESLEKYEGGPQYNALRDAVYADLSEADPDNVISVQQLVAKQAANVNASTIKTPTGESAIARANREFDAGNISESERDALIKKAKHIGGGVSQTVNILPEGNVELTKPTTNDLQEHLISSAQSLGRLQQVGQEFDERHLQLGPRVKNFWTAAKEKLNIDVTPGDQQQLAEYTTFRRGALENLNIHINDLTGKQLSRAEAKRLRAGMPDPGEGIIPGNSPTEFKANFNGVVKSIRMARARTAYAIKNGIPINGPDAPTMFPNLSLDGMEAIMERRADEMEAEYRQQSPDITNDQLRDLVSKQIISEFMLDLSL